ncbi:MAG: dehydratase [Alphaproteobacteria bacterium]|nr:dehydratase [Alphaproteobacteria bacterium]
MPMPANQHFEDFTVGQSFETTGRTVGEADILMFAGLSGDYTRIHMDAEFAKRSIFGERVAHGALGIAIMTGLLTQLGTVTDTAMGLLEMTCRFTAPLRLGDTIHVRQTVADKRETSKPDRGIVTFDLVLLNQRNESVIVGSEKIMVRRRGGG